MLCKAINLFTTGEDSSIEPGLKQNLFYLLKRAAKIIKGAFLQKREDDAAAEIEKFTCILEMNEDQIFGDATYELNRNRNINLRKPSALPLEEDIVKFREYILKNMQDLSHDPYCVCARVTLLNGRRGWY